MKASTSSGPLSTDCSTKDAVRPRYNGTIEPRSWSPGKDASVVGHCEIVDDAHPERIRETEGPFLGTGDLHELRQGFAGERSFPDLPQVSGALSKEPEHALDVHVDRFEPDAVGEPEERDLLRAFHGRPALPVRAHLIENRRDHLHEHPRQAGGRCPHHVTDRPRVVEARDPDQELGGADLGQTRLDVRRQWDLRSQILFPTIPSRAATLTSFLLRESLPTAHPGPRPITHSEIPVFRR